jgi:hypothetical protein
MTEKQLMRLGMRAMVVCMKRTRGTHVRQLRKQYKFGLAVIERLASEVRSVREPLPLP